MENIIFLNTYKIWSKIVFKEYDEKSIQSHIPSVGQFRRKEDKDAAEIALLELEEKRGEKYSIVINSWKNNWDELSAYFQYSEPVRKIIYLKNTIE